MQGASNIATQGGLIEITSKDSMSIWDEKPLWLKLDEIEILEVFRLTKTHKIFIEERPVVS